MSGILGKRKREHVYGPERVSNSPTSDPPIVDLELEASACRRLIGRDFSPHELIPLIEEIFTRKQEVMIFAWFGRDAAQTFIDVVHEVRPTVLHLCGCGVT